MRLSRPDLNIIVWFWLHFLQLLKFVGAKFDSIIPSSTTLPGGPLSPSSAPNPTDEVFVTDINNHLSAYIKALEATQLRAGLFEAMSISARGNQYLQDNKLDNAFLASNPERCAEVILMAVNLIYTLSPLLHPFMPETSASICKQLNAPMRSLPEAFSIDILPGHTIGKADHLFVKIKDGKEDEWRRKYGGETTAASATPAAPAPVSKKEAAKRAKAAAAALAALPRTPEVIALEAQIKEQADRVVGLKKDNVGGVELAEAVRILKERKAEMDTLAQQLSSLSV